MKEYIEDKTFVQLGVVHGSVGQCGSAKFPGIYARLEDPEIFDFVTDTLGIL